MALGCGALSIPGVPWPLRFFSLHPLFPGGTLTRSPVCWRCREALAAAAVSPLGRVSQTIGPSPQNGGASQRARVQNGAPRVMSEGRAQRPGW